MRWKLFFTYDTQGVISHLQCLIKGMGHYTKNRNPCWVDYQFFVGKKIQLWKFPMNESERKSFVERVQKYAKSSVPNSHLIRKTLCRVFVGLCFSQLEIFLKSLLLAIPHCLILPTFCLIFQTILYTDLTYFVVNFVLIQTF